MDSNTGRLALPDPLDYERDSNVYYLRIRAEEVGSRLSRRQSSEVNVQILLKDLNDNSPEFFQQRYRYSDKCFGYSLVLVLFQSQMGFVVLQNLTEVLR